MAIWKDYVGCDTVKDEATACKQHDYDWLKDYKAPLAYTINISEQMVDSKKLAKALSPGSFVKKIPTIERVIFNPPATVVIWSDGTKTIVKASKGKKKSETDEFSEEIGLAMAIAKKYFGSRSAFLKAVENGSRPAEKAIVLKGR